MQASNQAHKKGGPLGRPCLTLVLNCNFHSKQNAMKKPKYEVKILPQLEIACGLDIHKDTIFAFISDQSGATQLSKEFRTFSEDLHQLVDWIRQAGVKNCIMESTGIYWISLYHMLVEAQIDVVVANPGHVKQIPKRKTDKKDARWLCMLLINGLVRPSLIPGETQFELREFCRTRTQYTQHITQSFNRIVRIIERANIKLRSVVSNVRTKSSIQIIQLLAANETDEKKYEACCHGSLKKKWPMIYQAIQGRLTDVDRKHLQLLLNDISHFEANMVFLDKEIQHIVESNFQKASEMLQKISGIGPKNAQTILGEIGKDMTTFPTGDHLTSWAGLAPGNHESAGKRKRVSTKKGNKFLRVALVSVAWGAVRTKDSYWRHLYYDLKARMSSQKAIIAIARRLLKVIYTTLREGYEYKEGGLAHYLQVKRNVRNAASMLAT
jgi:transposase